jgi:hypothetical protein
MLVKLRSRAWRVHRDGGPGSAPLADRLADLMGPDEVKQGQRARAEAGCDGSICWKRGLGRRQLNETTCKVVTRV